MIAFNKIATASLLCLAGAAVIPAPPPHGGNWRNENLQDRVSFSAHLLSHSYAVFALETGRENVCASAK